MRKLLICLILLVGTIGCSKKDGAETGIVSQELRPTDIQIAVVAPADIKDIYTLPGVAEAWEVVSVATETSGPVRWIGPSEGDYIKAGEPIMRINTEMLASNLESTKVQFESRKKDFIRTGNLYKQQSVSQKSYDDALDAVTLAEVSYKLALDEYNKGIVKSPVTGIIDEIIPRQGEYVSTGTHAVKVVQMDRLKIYIDVPEMDVPFLKLGQVVDVYPADISGKTKSYQGSVNYISVTSNPLTLTYKARVDLAPNEEIRPGRIVRTDIVRRDLKNTIIVNLYTIVDKDGKKVVYVEENGKAIEKPVEMGPMTGTGAVIHSGLNAGDRLVVSGQQFLSNNVPVRIAE